MKKWLSSLPSSRSAKDLSGKDLPWLDSPSIHTHITRSIDPKTGKLSEKGQDLPDEERRYSGVRFRWVPGAMEGVFSHHISPEEASLIARQVVKDLVEIANEDSGKAKIDLYKILLQDEVLAFIDEALREFVSAVSPAKLRDFALFLAQTAPDRGPVKFAIALLGVIGDLRDLYIVTLLGLHEEFTLYSAVALRNMLENPEAELWKLAQKVDGWGKVHIVERLASTDSAEIKDWLLREGYQNSVMYEYLAYDCAVGGGLRDALAVSEIDEELLHAAGDILQALIIGGPAKDINDYADAAAVILRYLEVLEGRAKEVQQYIIVDSILGYLSEDWDAAARSGNGWDAQKRDQAIVLANRILQKPFWPMTVRQALNSEENRVFYPAARAADLLGIDTWDVHWSRLTEKPLDGGRWFHVMQRANPQRIAQIIDLAIQTLPLEQIATGPSDQLGMGPNYQAHHCLDFIVQDLRHFPAKGWPLIAASLKSPVIRNRNMALNALEKWGKEYWPEGAEAALVEAARIEPVKDVKERLEKMIQKGNPG